jgi:hypothetical protein
MFERRALVELAADVPETGLSFLRADYPVFDAAVPLGPTDTDQLAVARRAAYGGLHARPAFRAWDGEQPGLHREWVDAGERLEPRLGDLTDDMTSGQTEFADAAELACSAIKTRALRPVAIRAA